MEVIYSRLKGKKLEAIVKIGEEIKYIKVYIKNINIKRDADTVSSYDRCGILIGKALTSVMNSIELELANFKYKDNYVSYVVKDVTEDYYQDMDFLLDNGNEYLEEEEK